MLPIIRSNAEYDIGNVLPFILRGKVKQKFMDLLCRSFRRSGICSLFIDGSPHALLQNLQKSGAAFLHCIMTDPGIVSVLSKAYPFFDSISCNDFTTAHGIARTLKCPFNKDEEYEDDFIFVSFLMQKFFLDSSPSCLEETMKRFEVALDGIESARFDICTAFMNKDDKLFSKSLKTLIKEHAERYNEGRKQEYMLEEEWATDGQLFIEGLALIRLAEHMRMSVEGNYALIPSLVRAEVEIVFGPDTWRKPS